MNKREENERNLSNLHRKKSTLENRKVHIVMQSSSSGSQTAATKRGQESKLQSRRITRMVSTPGMMGRTTWANTSTASWRVKESLVGKMEISMSANSWMERCMAKESSFGQTAKCMKVSTSIAKSKGVESTPGLMVTNTREK